MCLHTPKSTCQQSAFRMESVQNLCLSTLNSTASATPVLQYNAACNVDGQTKRPIFIMLSLELVRRCLHAHYTLQWSDRRLNLF